jgi:hypothetical protein
MGEPGPPAAAPRSSTPSGHHAIVAAIVTVAILIAVPVAMVTRGHDWTLRPFAFGIAGDDLVPKAWSPDGTKILFAQLERFVVVRASDRQRLFAGYGSWPVWVDDDTVDAVRDIGSGRSQIARVDVTGRNRGDTLPPVLKTAKLVEGGPIELAATGLTDFWTTVLDSRTGRVIAELPGVRAIRWVSRGVLVTKTVERDSSVQGQLPGHLGVWTARDGLRPIGGDVFEIADEVAVAPNGDAVVCRCALATDASTEGSIVMVPFDGGPTRKLFDLTRGNVNIQTNFGWLSDGTLVVLDGLGLHRFSLDGVSLPAPTLAADDLPAPKYAGRAYVLGDRIVIGSQLAHSTEGRVRLTIRGLDGTLELDRTMTSLNDLWLLTDHDRPRALVGTDPERPGEAAFAYFVLDRS